ncbi:tRNA lysidine(34) synthetase TilS [Metamycoplasma canadense]|uniref:tRNA(Ile)-lysidine synthase n=1 Tax=Metamycoplasma canadense TaxID=29554 RepID=A0A077LB90_9BACT|nr:tRNA lysidine(34) synthetase TilS [Metamycoplasma canadense]BAP39444.1 tRNA(Ile)-lysidine synthase [Metamycoplasma canadense]
MENNFEEIKTLFYNEFNKANKNLENTYILGISGGPDSMWLLNLMKDLKIIVACVNYNKREDSWKDQKIVEDFCIKNNIKYEILVLDKNLEYNGNFQKIARDQRYKFYRKLYKKYKASSLILAHHKDDTLETFLFQKESKREPYLFGILLENNLLEMNVFRPMINLWFKNEILEMCNKFSIPFAVDYTNNLPLYTRNKIRIKLSKKTKDEKDKLIDELNEINLNLIAKNKEIELQYLFFKNSNFNYKNLNLNSKIINEILFKYLHENIENIKLSSKKIDLFKNFIKSQKNFKSFKINKQISISKDQGILKINKN